jgi:hypothetical protein
MGMVAPTLFAVETAVKLTRPARGPIIAPMPSRVSCVALVAGAVAALACNDGLQPTPAATAGTTCPAGFKGICGSVSFRGAVPDSTQAVFVVAFATFPRTLSELFTFQPALPTPLALGNASDFYTVPLPDGRYEWVVAVWQKVGTLTPQTAPTLLAETGFFRDSSDTTKRGVVVVNGTGTDHVDFVIDFTNRHAICTYFPPCP